jgi:hypothetical protein
MAHASNEPQSHGQIERRAFFANVRGSKINRDALAVKLEAAIAQRGLDAFAAFLDGIVR